MEHTIEIECKELPRLWILTAIVEFPAGGNWSIETKSFVGYFSDLNNEVEEFKETVNTEGFSFRKMQVSWIEPETIDKLVKLTGQG